MSDALIDRIPRQIAGAPALFIGQTRTRLVQGKSKWKVRHRHPATSHIVEPHIRHSMNEQWPEDITDLEKMYMEFCEKAYEYLRTHGSLQGESHPSRIIFPDFYYELLPSKFPVE